MPTNPLLERISNASNETVFCSGTLSVGPLNGNVYYEHDGGFKRINLFSASDDDIQALTAACVPEILDVNKDALYALPANTSGPSHCTGPRRLESTQFSSTSDLNSTHISQIIEHHLAIREYENCRLRFEPYKLNIFGEGGFSAPRQESTRDDNLFGSLVIAFPYPYEGGSLILHHYGNRYTFDSSEPVSTKSDATSSVRFIAFVSDVEHEVALVRSGHRITLTYNIYLQKNDRIPDVPIDTDSKRKIEAFLKELIATVWVLPNGGRIGFWLSRRYPAVQAALGQYNPDEEDDNVRWQRFSDSAILNNLRKNLEGVDATIYQICQNLGLSPSLRLFYGYGNKNAQFLLEKVPRRSGADSEDNWVSELIFERNADIIALKKSQWGLIADEKPYPTSRVHPIEWVVGRKTKFLNPIIHAVPRSQGGYATNISAYYYPCIIAEVRDLESRGL